MSALSNYTLGVPGFAARTLDELGIEEVSISIKSRAICTASFEIPMARATADPAFGYGSAISLRQGGVQIFYGTIQEDPKSVISGESEAHSYIVVDPWWHLSTTVYQQSWAVRDNDGTIGSEHRSHLTLFQDVNGDKIKTGAQIRDALQWAIDAGAPFQIGNILEGVYAPTRDVKDITAEAVIKQSLIWTPDAVGRMDYATTPPTLHVQRQADLGNVLLSMGDGIISDTLQINPRHDLQVPSVTIKYEQTHADDGNSWTSTSVDTYPPGSSEQVPKAIVQTLELSGSEAAQQKQAVITKPIPEWNGNNASTIINWLRAREPWLNDLVSSSDDVKLLEGSYYAKIDANQKNLDGTAFDSGIDVGDLPNELVSGSITDWMQKAYPNLKAANATVGCALCWKTNLSGKADLSGLTDEKKAQIKQWFNLVSDTADPNYNKLWRYVGIVATNASTKIYAITTAFDSGEAPPQGIAQSLYQAFGTLYYDVSFSMVDDELVRPINLGDNLHLAGDRDEYLTMNAPVQTLAYSLARGRTTVKCGPPEHLGVQELVEYLRGLRNTSASLRAGERTTGEAPRALTVYGTGWTPRNVTPNPPGGGGGASVTLWHPFLVSSEDVDENGAVMVSVDYFSDLWKSLSEKQTIEGLDASFPVAVGNLIWLRIGVSDAITANSALIEHGDPWDNYPDPVVLDGTTQTYYNQLIAEVVEESDPRDGLLLGDGDKRVKVIQRLKNSVLCTLWAKDGFLRLITMEKTL